MKPLNLHIGINPIIVKELRSRMREARAFVTLTAVLLLLGTISYLLYRMAVATQSYSYMPLSPQIGQMLFVALAFLELLMVCAIAPAVTAGAISSEQEKLTYEMLLATPLHPASILWGKLVSALSYVFLLIFAAIPMSSLIFIFGGVSPRDMVKALVVLVTVTVTFGILGLFMSVWLRRTSRATVLSYLFVAALLFGTLFVYIAVGIIRQAEPPRWLLVANPLSALASALSQTTGFDTPVFSLLNYLGMGLSGNLRMLSGTTISQTAIPRPLYHYSLPFYAGLSLVLYLLSTRLILPARRWRLKFNEILLAIALLLCLGGVVTLAFTLSADRYENASIFSNPTPSPLIVPEKGMPAIEPPSVWEEAYPVPSTVIIQPPALEQPYPAPDTELPDDLQGAIYGAALRQIVLDYFAGQSPLEGTIYLVDRTDDKVGDPNLPIAEPRTLPEPVKELINATLERNAGDETNLSEIKQVLWVEDRSVVPLEQESGQVVGGGVILTVGNLSFQQDGSVLVSTSLYQSNLGGMGKTYQLVQTDGSWEVIGDTGFSWES